VSNLRREKMPERSSREAFVRTFGVRALGALLALGGAAIAAALLVTVVALARTGRAWGVDGSVWAESDVWELVAAPVVAYGMCRLGVAMLVATWTRAHHADRQSR